MARIIVADDEELVRGFVRRGLELAGHEVQTADDGAQALETVRALAGRVDLLVSDIKMPVMDGIALALIMARDWPGVPVLLMTGYADQRERASGLETLIAGLLTKPFTLEELQAAAGAALGLSPAP